MREANGRDTTCLEVEEVLAWHGRLCFSCSFLDVLEIFGAPFIISSPSGIVGLQRCIDDYNQFRLTAVHFLVQIGKFVILALKFAQWTYD